MYRFQLLRKSTFNFGRPVLHLLRVSREFSTCIGSSNMNAPELEKKDGKQSTNAANRSVEPNADVVQAFKELGVYASTEVLMENWIKRPTAIQRAAMPLMLRFKNVVVRAKTGSGKTFAYLISMAQTLNFLADPDSPPPKIGPSAIIILPTFELCLQTKEQLEPFLKDFVLDTDPIVLESTTPSSERDALLPRNFDVVISTPDCVRSCLENQSPETESPFRDLELLILDEVDLLLSNGYEGDLRSILAHVPNFCRCLLFSSNPSADVEQLKRVAIGNPYIVTLPGVGDAKVEIVPYNVEQFYVTCDSQEKLIHFVYLLDHKHIRDKVVIFTHSISMSKTLKQYIGKYVFLRAAVVDPEMPVYSRQQILEDFNAGRIDQLVIVTSKQGLDWESVVVGEINFDNVNTVFNFDMPETAGGYAHRVDRTGRSCKIGKALSLVSPEEMAVIEEIKSSLGDEDSRIIVPYKGIRKDAVERYRPKFEVYTEEMKLEARGLSTTHLFPRMLEACGVPLSSLNW